MSSIAQLAGGTKPKWPMISRTFEWSGVTNLAGFAASKWNGRRAPLCAGGSSWPIRIS